MKKFKVTVSREWTEYGEVEVEADDASDAREIASEILSSDNCMIEWSDSMDPGKDIVEDVTEV